MSCGVCGGSRLIVFYNGRIAEQYQGVREKITVCEYCKTSKVEREAG